MEEKEKVIYAGAVYEVIYRGERVLHLRSLRARSLVIHVSINSEFLKPYEDENGKKWITR
jgi:hypothetical protein